MKRFCPLFLAAALIFAVADARAQTGPMPPCRKDTAPVPATVPAYAALGSAPNVAVWNELDPAEASPCLVSMAGVREVVVALAGRFRGPADVNEIAARFGAISATVGLRYWSATDGEWRPLVEAASAVSGPEPDAPRPDFTAAEIMSGRMLHFRQEDTRSTSTNLYALTARESAPDRLVVDMVNRSPIRILVLTIFPADALAWSYFLTRLETSEDGTAVWGYYGISSARSVPLGGHESSFINRAAAAFRFYAGLPADRGPPLAP